MRTLDEYLDLAKSRAGLRSDRALSLRVGIAATGVGQYRTRRTWPDDGTMIRLAELAGIDPAEALLDLSAWRSKEPARSVYLALAAKLSASVAPVLIAAVLVAGSTRTQAEQRIGDFPETIHYAIFRRAILRLFKDIAERFYELPTRTSELIFALYTRLQRVELCYARQGPAAQSSGKA